MNTASNSRPFARCSVSRLTPCAASPSEENRRRRSSTNDAASPSKAAASCTSRAEILLAHGLTLAELVGQALEPAGVERSRAHGLTGRCRGTLEPPRQSARRIALEERRPLEGDAGLVQQLFEVGQTRVRAGEDRRLLERAVERAQLRDDRGSLVLGRGIRAHDRFGAVRQHRAQCLLGAAEVGHEPVGECEHLRRRAVVLLEPRDDRMREPLRHREQIVGARTGEPVDRLIIVADDAEVVSLAEPQVEQLPAGAGSRPAPRRR